MEKDKNNSKTRLIRNLLRRNLFIPGHCDDPESEAPTLNIRVFEGEYGSVGLAFTSFQRMKRYFDSCGLYRMKYMEVTAPSHLEAFCHSGLGVVVDPDSPEERHLTVKDLRAAGLQ